MSRKRTGDRGKIIRDESADQRLVKPIRKAGWRVIELSPVNRGIKLKDPALAKKYARGHFPILTTDYSAYRLNPDEKGATGFVELESVSPEDFDDYYLKVFKFFSTHTATDIRGKVWMISLKGEARVKRKI